MPKLLLPFHPVNERCFLVCEQLMKSEAILEIGYEVKSMRNFI